MCFETVLSSFWKRRCDHSDEHEDCTSVLTYTTVATATCSRFGFPWKIPKGTLRGLSKKKKKNFNQPDVISATGIQQCLYDHDHGTEIPRKTRGIPAEIPREVKFLASHGNSAETGISTLTVGIKPVAELRNHRCSVARHYQLPDYQLPRHRRIPQS